MGLGDSWRCFGWDKLLGAFRVDPGVAFLSPRPFPVVAGACLLRGVAAALEVVEGDAEAVIWDGGAWGL